MDTLPAESTRSCAGDTCSAVFPFFLHLSHHNIAIGVVSFSAYGTCEVCAGRRLWKRQHGAIILGGQVRLDGAVPRWDSMSGIHQNRTPLLLSPVSAMNQ